MCVVFAPNLTAGCGLGTGPKWINLDHDEEQRVRENLVGDHNIYWAGDGQAVLGPINLPNGNTWGHSTRLQPARPCHSSLNLLWVLLPTRRLYFNLDLAFAFLKMQVEAPTK
jgi:hypothetical protein